MKDIKIVNKKLIMIPLKEQQLISYLEGDHEFLFKAKKTHKKINIPPPLVQAIREDILPGIRNNPESYELNTLWLIIKKREEAVIGEFCLKGINQNNASIEIGYGIHPEYQNQGYMKEALNSICTYLLSKNGIKKIIAYTSGENLASIKTLHRNGFKKQNKTGKGKKELCFIKE